MWPLLLAALAAVIIVLLLFPFPQPRARLPEWVSRTQQNQLAAVGRWIAILRLGPVRAVAKVIALLHRPATRERIEMQLRSIRMDGQLSAQDIFAMKALAIIVPVPYGLILMLGAGNLIPVIFALLLGVPCYLYPEVWLDGKFRRRKEQLARELPAFLNTLAVTVDAGLNLIPALGELSSRRRGVLAEEFRDTLQSMEVMGVAPENAFENLSRRCDVKELSLFVGALEQTLRKGGAGISLMLREQARVAWQSRKKQTEEIGQKASFKMFLPLLFLVLPALGIFLMGPALVLLWRDFGM